jgi:hypothetical protein
MKIEAKWNYPGSEATRDLVVAEIQDSTSHTSFHQKQYLIKSSGEK